MRLADPGRLLPDRQPRDRAAGGGSGGSPHLPRHDRRLGRSAHRSGRAGPGRLLRAGRHRLKPPSRDTQAVPSRAAHAAGLILAAVALLGGCSHSDGRELADPDPDLTATTAAPAVVAGASPGSQAGSIPPSSVGAGGLIVASSSFEAGGPLPARFTCVGGDVSPALTWSSVPAGTAELAVVMRSPAAGNSPYWLITGIDPSAPGLAEGDQPAAVVPWTGPCPTPG